MFKEIGSNFWLEPKQLEEQEKVDLNLRYVSEEEDAVYTSSGRGAISLILSSIEPKNKYALLPIYTCESVIMPFVKKGYDINFFDIEPDLTINKVKFLEFVKKNNPGIILLHGYFGFDSLHGIRPEYRKLRDQGIIIIEDITHSVISKYDMVGADYYLASLRKWLALPDGGVAISIKQKLFSENFSIHKNLMEQNIKAIKMKYKYTKDPDPKLKAEYRKIFYSMEDLLDKDCSIYSMSNISENILKNTDFNEIRKKRRNNFKYLLNLISEFTFISPVFKTLPKNVTPLYLPVYISGIRGKLQKHMAKNEIYMPVHWPMPKIWQKTLTKNAEYIYENILSIPCDQRYSNKDMDRIAKTLSMYENT